MPHCQQGVSFTTQWIVSYLTSAGKQTLQKVVWHNAPKGGMIQK